MKLRRKHTSPKNKGGGEPGGTRPQAHTWVRQYVAAAQDHRRANCRSWDYYVDSQIVAWPAVQGHRLKSRQVRRFADLINYFNMHNGFYDKNNHNKRRNGYENRQTKRPRQILQRPPEDAHYQKAAVDRYLGRDQRDRSSSFRGSSERGRCGEKGAGGFQRMEKKSSIRSYKSSGPGGEKWIIDLCPWFERTFKKLLLSTIVRIVLLRQLKKYTHLFAAGIAGPLAKWKKLNLEGHSLISLNSTVNTLQSADKTLENSLPSNPGREIAWGFLYPDIKINRTRPQAHN